jgi:hypothetical protein
MKGSSEAKTEEPPIATNAFMCITEKGRLFFMPCASALGEAALNQALTKYLRDRSKYSANVPPYPTVINLLKYLQTSNAPRPAIPEGGGI